MINTRVSQVLPPSISAKRHYGEKVGGGALMAGGEQIVAVLTVYYLTVSGILSCDSELIADETSPAASDDQVSYGSRTTIHEERIARCGGQDRAALVLYCCTRAPMDRLARDLTRVAWESHPYGLRYIPPPPP